jgi:hypothetical protein
MVSLTKMDQPFLARMRSMEEIAFKLQILMPEEMLTSVGTLQRNEIRADSPLATSQLTEEQWRDCSLSARIFLKAR